MTYLQICIIIFAFLKRAWQIPQNYELQIVDLEMAEISRGGGGGGGISPMCVEWG